MARRHVEIVQLTAPALRALADADLATAQQHSPVALTPYLVGPECRVVWQMRRDQVEADPACAAWVTGVVRDVRTGALVGRAGFHAPPDADGVVEIGYAIDPAHRRQGWARAALGVLLDRARRDPDVRVAVVSISPGNTASLSLAASCGFVAVGEQWDDEDGLEVVHELAVGGPTAEPAAPGRLGGHGVANTSLPVQERARHNFCSWKLWSRAPESARDSFRH